jgi:hypothetical protein
LLHALGFFHQHGVPERDDYVTIKWENIQPGNVSVFTQNKHIKDEPVPWAQITHTDITSTTHLVTIMYSSNGFSRNLQVLQK